MSTACRCMPSPGCETSPRRARPSSSWAAGAISFRPRPVRVGSGVPPARSASVPVRRFQRSRGRAASRTANGTPSRPAGHPAEPRLGVSRKTRPVKCPVIVRLEGHTSPRVRAADRLRARGSTDAQDLTAQRDALAALRVPPDRLYIDHGLTGTHRDRPGRREASRCLPWGGTEELQYPSDRGRSAR